MEELERQCVLVVHTEKYAKTSKHTWNFSRNPRECTKKSERVYEEFPKDIDFIEWKDPVCRFYDKKPDVNLR